MPIGQADLENAVREGWARDEDNELSIDGYSATIQVTTDDGTSGLNLKNSTGAVSFSAMSNGDGYFGNRLGIGTFNPETTLEVIGKTRTNELQVASGATPGYVLTSDGNGNATWAPSTASGGVTDATFQENKTAQEEINDTIIASLDGYVVNQTFEENKGSQEQINQFILQSLDGYAIMAVEDQRWIDSSQQLQDLRNSLDGYVINSTFEENKGAQEEINHQVLIALDGYAQNSTESEHYTQLSQAIQDIISVIDGYSTDAEFSGLTNTVTENNNQQQQINQSVIQALDGYAIRAIEDQRWVDSSQQLQDLRNSLDGYVVNQTFEENKGAQEQINDSILQSLDGYTQDSTESEHYRQLSQAIQDIVSVIDGYATDAEFVGLTNTVTENNNQQQQINQNIRQALDGYASDITVSEHYQQFSQAIQDITSTIDGYSTDVEFAGLTNTVEEHKAAQAQINQSILKDLDGYETKISAQDNYDAIGAAINTIRKDLEDGYADISGSAADGYIAFFTGPTSIAGDNDLYFDRVNNQLQVSAFKLTTTPNDGYVITSDTSGNATWQENPGNPARHRELDQLVHNIAETSYETFTYDGSNISVITTWTSTEMVTKIREEQFTYTGSKVSTIVTIQYNHLGVAIETITENYTYSGNQVIDITRTLT